MTTGFGIHEVRHWVKLLHGDSDTMFVENHDSVACPARDDDFSQLLVSDRTAHSFNVDTDARFCVRQDGNQLLMATRG